MTTTEKVNVKDAINAFVKRKGISKADLSVQLNVSSATLSNIEHERWEVLKDDVLNKIWHTVKPGDWKLIKTSNLVNVFALCDDTRNATKLVGLIGYPGAGKTTALKEYYKREKNTWYISGQKSMRPKRFFEKLLKQMGVMFTGTIYDMIEKLAEEFRTRPNSLLIIDEAGKLDQTMFMYLHDLRNETETTTGIIMAGVDYLKTNIEKAVEKQKQGMPEFYSRIIAWQILQRPTRSEIKTICESNGINDAEVIKQIQRVKDFRKVANEIKNELLMQKLRTEYTHAN